MNRIPAFVAFALALTGCAEGEIETAGSPGYRVSAPGDFVGRFPPNPFDPQGETLIEGAFRMEIAQDGEGVFVLDQQGSQVFALDADANLRRAVLGARGGGPGELQAPVAIESDPRGGVRVVDPRLRRLSWYGADGSLREELPTPWPVANFGLLDDGSAVYPTMDGNSLLALQSGEAHRELAIDPSLVPSALGDEVRERLISGSLRFFPLARDTLLMFQNRDTHLFGAWRVGLDPSRTRITGVTEWSIPDWIASETRAGEEPGERESDEEGGFRLVETVPFNSVRVWDRAVWLVPGIIEDVFAISVPLVEGDSASVVLPPETGIDCAVDAAVLGDRLVVLCQTEVRSYELRRVSADRFRQGAMPGIQWGGP